MPPNDIAVMNCLSVAEVFDIFSSEFDCEILAGNDGLWRRCYHCVVLETPDGIEWVSGGEMILTCGYALKDEIQYLAQFIHDAAERGVSAIAIKEGRFLPFFPEKMLQAADECGLPVIRIPRDATYTGVIARFYEKLFQKQHSDLVRAKNIDRRLLSLVSDYQKADEGIVVLSSMFNVSIAVYDRAFREISSTYISGSHQHREMMEQYRVLWKNRGSDADVPEVLETEYGTVYAWYIPFKDTGVAYCMCAISDVIFDHIQQEALLHGAMIMSNKYQAEERRVLQDLRMRRVTTEMLLNSDVFNENLAHSVEKDFSWTKSNRYVGIVVECTVQESESEEGEFRQYVMNVIDQLCAGKFLITEKQGRYYIFFSVKDRDAIIEWGLQLKRYTDSYPVQKHRFRLGISNIYSSLKDLPAMYHDCLVTNSYHQGEGLVWYDQNDIARFLYPLFEDRYFETCYDETITALTNYGKNMAGNLVETLSVYFECGMNHVKTAKQLYIHVETLRYRLEKVENVTGFKLSDPEGLIVLQLCIKRWHMLNKD